MGYAIKKAAVLGAGVMGAGIAAYLVNQGLSVQLLDRKEETKGCSAEDASVKNRLANNAIKRLLQQQLLTKDQLSSIVAGNFEDDLAKLKDVDWIIEVVVEDLQVKKMLFQQIEQVRSEKTIVSSNTSGLSIRAMIEECSVEFQKHFLGTHFFNPPQLLKLLELIPGEKTSTEVLNYMQYFCKEVLQKGVILAKDTPNFIANRLGTFGMFIALGELEKGDYSVGEIDSVMGPLIGRPSSATFRTADVVGIDTLKLVAKHMQEQAKGVEKEMYQLPRFINQMIENEMLGVKKGRGFYQKLDGEILELNVKSMEYEPIKKMKALSVEKAMQIEDVGERMNMLIYSDDRAGKLIWNMLSTTLRFAGHLHGEIADDIVSMDNALKWGFGWELGVFEIWDAIGVTKSVVKMKEEGKSIPPIAQQLMDKGYDSFYKKVSDKNYFFNGNVYERYVE
ncbi:3-hydroxyacyl-CoA dehydrogenase family protein [Bacillus sp. FJAT-42315]|uniref:3-hydroxyacyl-CoA dehydrogenase family protein n=1 Tax=Bacillus sp. FJAT-42315 TaxID=2014077 RepID=UPI000C23BD8E|nr:3-hydroxyacyl-CoA dehydrogenase family protein [Bacillus sp. FJAT-42315]